MPCHDRPGGGIGERGVLAQFLDEVERGEAGPQVLGLASDFLAADGLGGDAANPGEDDLRLIVADDELVQCLDGPLDDASLHRRRRCNRSCGRAVPRTP